MQLTGVLHGAQLVAKKYAPLPFGFIFILPPPFDTLYSKGVIVSLLCPLQEYRLFENAFMSFLT